MASAPQEEILSIRVPTGTKAKLKAVSGQPASVIVRYMITGYLQRAEQQAIPALQAIAAEGHAAGAADFDATHQESNNVSQ